MPPISSPALNTSPTNYHARSSSTSVTPVDTTLLCQHNLTMNSVLGIPPLYPHQLHNPRFNIHSNLGHSFPTQVLHLTFSSFIVSQPMNTPTGRKRKADDDDLRGDERMSASPTSSPNIPTQGLPRSVKRPRSGLVGRPLGLSRLLETLDVASLRNVLRSICDQHPAIAAEVIKSAPRPTVASALDLLKGYENALQNSFPFGGNPASDYAYYRVRPHLLALLDALSDFTPHFLPPNETQLGLSLSFLDGATEILHRLPNWDNMQHNLMKQNAYEEMSKAWSVVFREAEKRAGGISLHYEGWDKKLAKHNEQAQGRLQHALNELSAVLGWTGAQGSGQQHSTVGDDRASIRQELLSGNYGGNLGVRVGPW